MTEEVVFVDEREVVFVEAASEVLFVEFENDAFVLNLGEVGPPGPRGLKGDQGDQGIQGNPGPGVPAGGTAGQLLAKRSNTDFDDEWIDAPESLPAGGTTGQLLAKQSDTDGDAIWTDPPNGATNLSYTAAPDGGTVASDTGNDAAIPLADGTNAGLMAPAQVVQLAALPAGLGAALAFAASHG